GVEPGGRVTEAGVASFIAAPPPNEATGQTADDDFLVSLGDVVAPLTDFVMLPIDSSDRVSCPFHDDPKPSCKIYADHFHCYGCGARGDRVDWLMRVDGMTRHEAIAALQDWSGPVAGEQRFDATSRVEFARQLWNAGEPL